MKSANGFTLVELMIVIAVLLILILAVVPSFSPMISNNNISSSVSAFNQTINLARNEAVRRGAVVFVCPSNDQENCTATPWNQGWLVWSDLDNSGGFNPNEVIRVQGALSGAITMISANGNGGFNYNPNGFLNIAPGNALTFSVCDGARIGEVGRSIRIPAVGKNSSTDLNCA